MLDLARFARLSWRLPDATVEQTHLANTNGHRNCHWLVDAASCCRTRLKRREREQAGKQASKQAGRQAGRAGRAGRQAGSASRVDLQSDLALGTIKASTRRK